MTAKKIIILSLAAGAVVGAFAIASINTWMRPAFAQTDKAKLSPISSISAEDLSALRGLDKSYASLAEYVMPSVVTIRAEGNSGRDVFGRRMGSMAGGGTGVVFRADGWIMTNDHVVNGFDKVTVTLNDGREFVGEVRRAEENDIAVVKIKADGLTAASFADSSKVTVGQHAMAVGAPLGLDNTVTFGNISALGRQNEIPDSRLANNNIRFYADLIQTDAAINQGNSGGPLFNIDGQVIGINTAIASPSGGSVGIGFAIPANLAKMVGDTLIEKGKLVRGAIGVLPMNLKPYQLKEKGLDGGALVGPYNKEVEALSPAAKAGIKEGDIIVRIGSFPVKNEMDLRLAMYRIAPGTTTDVEVIRDGKRQTFKVPVLSTDKIMPKRELPAPRSGGGQDPSEDPFKQFEEMFRGRGPAPEKDPSTPKFERVGPVKLGVGIVDLSAEDRKSNHIPSGVDGVLVKSVAPGSPADQAGIEEGMLIMEIDGKTLKTGADLRAAIQKLKWGDSIQVKFGSFGEGKQIMSSTTVKF